MSANKPTPTAARIALPSAGASATEVRVSGVDLQPEWRTGRASRHYDAVWLEAVLAHGFENQLAAESDTLDCRAEEMGPAVFEGQAVDRPPRLRNRTPI